jgi:phosphoribosylanthranilate isomerase
MRDGEPGTFIKICGISSAEEAHAAVRAGADAVGFVFANGPRNVSLAHAAKIAGSMQGSVRKIGVFVDAPFSTISAHVETAGLDGVQLHGSEELPLIRQLKQSFPDVLVFKAVKMNGRESAEALGRFAGQVDAVMFDRKDVANPGRRVEPLPFDWLDGLPLGRVILAGGLHPDNVGRVVRELRPWGVDASGGLEVRPGRKDLRKVAAFVSAAREAERSL